MLRGVSFNIPNKYGKYILEILNPVNCKKYHWVIDSDQIWRDCSNGKKCRELFSKKNLMGGEFFDIISKENYYIVSARILGKNNGKINEKIDTYIDFKNSKCEIFILLVDSVYVEIYCKSLEVIHSLYNNAKKKKFGNLEYIDENDARVIMKI